MPGETIGDDKANPAFIAKALKGASFPMNKDELVSFAREHNDDINPMILHTLERLPDQEYRTMAEVEKGIGTAE